MQYIHLYAFSMKRKMPYYLADDLQAARLAQGLSQIEFAKLLGITQGHYSKIESGNAEISRKLAHRAELYLANLNLRRPDEETHLEAAAIKAMRKSKHFRSLISAAIKMHKDA